MTLSQIEMRIADIYSMARTCKRTSAQISKTLNEKVFSVLDSRSPSGRRRHSVYCAGYAAGIVARYRAEIWQNDVEFCYQVAGVLYSTHKKSARPTTEQFYAAGKGNVLADSPSSHYWKVAAGDDLSTQSAKGY